MRVKSERAREQYADVVSIREKIVFSKLANVRIQIREIAILGEIMILERFRIEGRVHLYRSLPCLIKIALHVTH